MPLFSLALLEEKNVPNERIFHTFSHYLSLLKQEKIWVTENQAKKIGYPRRKGEKAVGFRKISAVKEEKCYEPLYDRSQNMTVYVDKNIPFYYKKLKDIKKAGIEVEGTRETYALEKGSFVELYNVNTLCSQKGKQFFDFKTLSFPYFTKEIIQSIGLTEQEGRHVGYTFHQTIENVYKAQPTSLFYAVKTYRSKKEYLPYESEVHEFYGKVKEEQLNDCLAAIREEYCSVKKSNVYVKVYNMKKLVEKAGFLYFEPKELEKKKNYALFTDREFQYFPKAWKINKEAYVITGYTNYGKKVYELNEKGKALFSRIKDKMPQDLIISITQLKEVKELLNKEKSTIAQMNLKGVTEDGKYVFDVGRMKHKNKIRLRLLPLLQ